jgi:transketolase
MKELGQLAAQVRGHVLQMSHRAQTAHLASSLSVVDILVALYGGILRIDEQKPQDPARDRCILSKGHAVSALYAVLALRGFFPVDWLATFNQDGGCLPEQPSPGCVPGVELATGSLGHGLPVGLGMALAARMQGRDTHVYVVMSDGECQEGSVWEAALMAPCQQLHGLTVIVDHNKWQATGRTNEFVSLEPLVDKWRAFGWSGSEVDGHDLQALQEAVTPPSEPMGPRVIVAHTVKGKGVSFMEDDNNWHYRAPDDQELAQAFVELGLA